MPVLETKSAGVLLPMMYHTPHGTNIYYYTLSSTPSKKGGQGFKKTDCRWHSHVRLGMYDF